MTGKLELQVVCSDKYFEMKDALQLQEDFLDCATEVIPLSFSCVCLQVCE